MYDRWDALNKAAQRDCREWVPFRELSGRALAAAYAELGLPGDARSDVDRVLGSVGQWPLWPDVAETVPAWAAAGGVAGYRLGLLSNVDDDVFAATRAARLVEDEVALTSQRLGVYKPDPRLYTSALDRFRRQMVHVAASARDVRGALEAGIATVRLRRPGHRLDPEGPTPAYEITDIRDLPDVLSRVTARE